MTKVLGLLLCASCFLAAPASAQTAVNLLTNGDFETNTAGQCESNLSNSALSQYLATAVGFGPAGEIDVYKAACYGVAAISGTTKVGLSGIDSNAFDAFSLALSQPVFAGDALDLAFAAQTVPDFNPNLGIVVVGLSNSPNAFGVPVYTGSSTLTYAWEWFGANIIAPVDANFLTIRAAHNLGWVHVDAFSLALGTSSSLFCSGDGSGAACPCTSGTAVYRGCANSSFAAGARLYRTGSAGASAATDSMILTAAEVTGTGLFVQGTSLLAGGGVVFGDGLFCLTGTLSRLGIASPSGGVASLPHAGAATPLHIAGGVAAGDVRYYQMWFRDALPYCTTATFNLTQGITVTWGP